MGFLAPAARVVAQAMAAAMKPPPPPNITRWCQENVVFDERSSMPGEFNIGRFPFLAEVHEVLSPEHPALEVTFRGSAQLGKTTSLINPTLGAWHEYTPLDSLVVFPTTSAATDWVNNKWLPMRRQAPSLRAIFGDGRGVGENKDNTFNQETLNLNGSLKVVSAGSPDDLAGTTRRLIIMDDVSKFLMTPKGDPEELAISRGASFENYKALRISTAQIKGTCRVSNAFDRSDQRYYHVPCPHCGNMAPLTWENFKANIDPERLHAACFTCESCGCLILHSDKDRIMRLGKWVSRNPRGDHPGFHLWRAYAPQRDWASIAVQYARIMGWSRLESSSSAEDTIAKTVESETEQTFFNDVLGLPYEQATDAPDWASLRDRTENAADSDGIGRGILPAAGFIFTAGVDCQDDRMEVQLVAFGRNRKRWVIDYKVIPYTIGSEEGRAALTAILRSKWRTQLGAKFALDMLAIDGGTYTDDVWSWAKLHPWDRAIIVKGASSQNGWPLVPMKFNRRNDGTAKRQQKRGFMLNVSLLKGEFYTWLRVEDDTARGHCAFARGLGDEYYRQVTGEVRVLKRSLSGTLTSAWVPVPGVRNEALDTMNYAEAAARRQGWTSKTDEEWDRIDHKCSALPAVPQGDLFDAALGVLPDAVAAAPAKPEAANRPGDARRDGWIKPKNKGSWL